MNQKTKSNRAKKYFSIPKLNRTFILSKEVPQKTPRDNSSDIMYESKNLLDFRTKREKFNRAFEYYYYCKKEYPLIMRPDFNRHENHSILELNSTEIKAESIIHLKKIYRKKRKKK